MTTNDVAMEYARYAERVLPTAASPVQKIETKRAFFCGAMAMHYLVTRKLPTMSDDDAEAYLTALHDELERFAEDITEGKA